MENKSGKLIKDFIRTQSIPLEDREYMEGIFDDDLVAFKTTGGESVVILRDLGGMEHELLLQVGINTDTLILGLLRQEGFILYNFRTIERQRLQLIGEKGYGDSRKDEEFIGVNDCSGVYHLSEFDANCRLRTYRVGVYEVLS